MAINISADNTREDDDDQDGHSKPPNTFMKQKSKRKKLHLLSAKPLAKRLNRLSGMKLNSIKLKSFNSLANQLQQTLSPNNNHNYNCAKLNSTTTSTTGPSPESTSSNLVADNDDDFGWGSDFDEQSVDSSQVSQGDNSSYLLEIGKSSQDHKAIEDVIQDQGLSGQFRRIDNNQEQLGDQKLERRQSQQLIRESSINHERQQSGKVDQLESSSEIPKQFEQSEEDQNEQEDDEEDDDEAELRSLEARQGFRQIRDKLKVILDQRLAIYEQSATCEYSKQPVKETQVKPEHCKGMTGASNEFDCQSHCSDESSSSGLESNHSGSQDSGHSTQHSGYSSHSCNRANLQQPPSIEIESCSTSQQQSPVQCSSVSPSSEQNVVAEAPQQVLGEPDERRERFRQNRLIINSKLESMFKSRQPAVEVRSQRQEPVKSSITRSQSIAVKPTHQVALAESLEMQRSRLLEQQRQMSLKLKQKPRRKTAKRVLSSLANLDSGNEEDSNSTYANQLIDRFNQQQQQQPPEADSPTRLPFEQRQNSLTKQLSMICLRQSQPRNSVQLNFTQMVRVALGEQPQTLTCTPLPPPRAAQSLRQLVTDVIDDFEKPQLSSLTRNILSRSDSLSSELATTSADETDSNEQQTIRFKQHSKDHSEQIIGQSAASTSSSIASSIGHQEAQQLARHFHLHQQSALQANLAKANYISNQCHPAIGYPSSQIHLSSTPERLNSTSATAADQSMNSTMSTIDGLEYSRADSSVCQEPAAATGREAATSTAADQKLKSTTTIGSYLRNLRDFSRIKLAKVKLSNKLESRNNKPAAAQTVQLGGHNLAPSQVAVADSNALNNCNSYRLDSTATNDDQEPPAGSTIGGAWRAWRLKGVNTPEKTPESGLANHFVTISNRKWKSCHLRTSLMQIGFNGPDNGNSSPIYTGKHLNYLDNSKNFTDDDN